jgi:hypothetical protein
MSERDLHLDDARCADLVLGLLPDAEYQRVVAHARQCTACALRLRVHVAAGFRARADRPGAILALPRPERRRVARFLGGGAAAAAVLLAVVLWPRATLRTPAAVAWLATPSAGTLIRSGDAADARLEAGFAAYARRDLATAERELSAAHVADGAEQARRLYLAHVKLLHHDTRGALELLRSLDYIDLPAAVEHDAVRLLAQALRAEGEHDPADSLERALARSPEWAPILP